MGAPPDIGETSPAKPVAWRSYDTGECRGASVLRATHMTDLPDLFASWLGVVREFSFCRSSERNREANGNMIVFELQAAKALGATAHQLARFIDEAYQLVAARRTGLAWFYSWFDDMAGQIRLSLSSVESPEDLPFGCTLRLTRSPLVLGEELVAAAADGVIAWENLDVRDITDDTEVEEVDVSDYVLTVFVGPL